MTAFMKLQNGSDIRGIASEGVEGENVNLTPQIARQIGYAFANWLAKKSGCQAKDLKIGVGRDSRITGPVLLTAEWQPHLPCSCPLFLRKQLLPVPQ